MTYIRLTRREGIAAATAVALSFVLPEGRSLPKLCVFNRVTGLPCPACGLTRSFIALAHGAFGRAVRSNALGPPLFALFMGIAARFTSRPRVRIILTRGQLSSMICVIVLAWLAKLLFVPRCYW